VRFGVLGPLQVADADGDWLHLRGHRLRSLLAMLLFNANKWVPTERLVGALWPDGPPKSYTSNLHTYVSRLRERIDPVRLEHKGGKYRIQIEHDELDMLVFLSESDLGRRAARSGDWTTAADHLRRALAQWRDRPLADVHLPALDPDVARLETERLAAFEDCMEAELAAGRHTELVGELKAANAEHPLRERLAGQLMVALHRSGQQAEALAVYRETRRTLVEETGIEPGTGLREVQTRILRGESRPAMRPICQLPADISDFSGRQESIVELKAALLESPLVVLSGEPGVGKSTLAIRVAHQLRPEFPDGQLFAHLAGASGPRNPAHVLAEWLHALGVSGQAVPDDLQARAAALRGRLTDKKVLILLDDAADPAQVRPLLPGTPGCATIITSRRRLSGLPGTHRVTLSPFTDAEAGQLLERIAGARVSGKPQDAARIVAACGNLPLALRIAGTRLALRPQLELGTLADRLEDERRKLDELSVSDLEVRSSVALSYRSLSPAARNTLLLLGMMGMTNLPAWAVAVLHEGSDVDGAIEDLIESSLVQPAGFDGCGEPRYRMHDIIRAFSWELAQTGEGYEQRSVAAERLVGVALALVDLAVRRLPRVAPLPDIPREIPAPGLPQETVDRLLADPDAWLGIERPQFVAGFAAACRIGWQDMAMRFLERLARHLWLHGHHGDLRTCATVIADAARTAGDEQLEARADAILALVLHARGSYAESAVAFWSCVHRLRRFGDQPALAWALNNLANCLIGLGDCDEALNLAVSAASLFDEIGDGFGVISALRAQAAALHRLGRADESVPIATEALARARNDGEPWHIALSLDTLAWSLVITGRLADALPLAEEAVTLLRHPNARSPLALATRTLGAIQAGLGHRTLAVQAFSEALAIARERFESPRELSCMRAIAASWIGDGRAGAAIPVLRRCIEGFRAMGRQPATTITLRLLAVAYDNTANPELAEKTRTEADRLSNPRDVNTQTVVRLLINLAEPDSQVPGAPHQPARHSPRGAR
jgi:DNA-binding SARP family transcriptional activator